MRQFQGTEADTAKETTVVRINTIMVLKGITVGMATLMLIGVGTPLWAMPMTSTIDTTVGITEVFNFDNIQANLQISIPGVTPAGSGPYPNNTQTIMASSGIFEILGTGPIFTIGELLLLITVPTTTGLTPFTLTPISGGTAGAPISVASSNFTTISGDVNVSGNRPGNGSFSAFGPAAAFAFVNLGIGGIHAPSGLGSFTPKIDVGFNFGTGPGVTTSFFAYGADNSDLEKMSSNSGSLTFLAAPAPIPEPGTLLLIGSGLVGLGAGAWRRKKS